MSAEKKREWARGVEEKVRKESGKGIGVLGPRVGGGGAVSGDVFGFGDVGGVGAGFGGEGEEEEAEEKEEEEEEDEDEDEVWWKGEDDDDEDGGAGAAGGSNANIDPRLLTCAYPDVTGQV
ncbi:hypothetical protein V8E51_006456 [Hyaloscypha variabilis]